MTNDDVEGRIKILTSSESEVRNKRLPLIARLFVILLIVLTLIAIFYEVHSRRAFEQTQVGLKNFTEEVQNPVIESSITSVVHDELIEGQDEGILSGSGYLRAKYVSTVSSEITGRISKVVVAEGDKIERGALIAELDRTFVKHELSKAQLQVELSEIRLEKAKERLARSGRVVDRYNTFAKSSGVSDDSLDRIRTDYSILEYAVREAGSNLELAAENLGRRKSEFGKMKIVAPFKGTISSINAQIGEIVSPTSTGGFTRSGIATIVDAESLYAEILMPENYLSRLYKGQKVSLVADAFPNLSINGYIDRFGVSIDTARAAIPIFVELDIDDDLLRPNMAVSAKFENRPLKIGE